MNRIQLGDDPLSPNQLTELGNVLQNGGIVCHPTETVYGLAVRWDSSKGIERLTALKGRAPDKPYSLLVSDTRQIVDMLGWSTPKLQKLLETLYPAPVTLILAHQQTFKLDFWNQFESLGFRLPDHQLSLALVEAAGAPIITTSANSAGQPPPVSATDVEAQIASGADILVDAGPCREGLPSTIISLDLESGTFDCFREGKFSAEAFEILFRNV